MNGLVNNYIANNTLFFLIFIILSIKYTHLYKLQIKELIYAYKREIVKVLSFEVLFINK